MWLRPKKATFLQPTGSNDIWRTERGVAIEEWRLCEDRDVKGLEVWEEQRLAFVAGVLS